jgi:hypothetical protein
MTRKIVHLIVEHKNILKPLRTRNLDHEVERTQEDSHMSRAPTLDREVVLLSNPMKEFQQREDAMTKEDKNQNGKRNTETKITGKKARKINKKGEKVKKLQKGPEGTSWKEYLQNWNFIRLSEQLPMALFHGEEI